VCKLPALWIRFLYRNRICFQELRTGVSSGFMDQSSALKSFVYKLTVSAVFIDIVAAHVCFAACCIFARQFSVSSQILQYSNSTPVAYSHLHPVLSKLLAFNHPMCQCSVQYNSDLRIFVLNISIFWTLCFLFICPVPWTSVFISRTDEMWFLFVCHFLPTAVDTSLPQKCFISQYKIRKQEWGNSTQKVTHW